MIILELKKTLIGPIHINTWSCNCLRIAASAADGSSKLFITKSMPSPNDSVLHKWETELGPLVAMAGKPRRTSFEVKRQKRLQKKHRRSMFKGFLSKQYIIAFAAMDIYSNQFCSYDKKPNLIQASKIFKLFWNSHRIEAEAFLLSHTSKSSQR